jgi:hypothetical protein
MRSLPEKTFISASYPGDSQSQSPAWEQSGSDISPAFVSLGQILCLFVCLFVCYTFGSDFPPYDRKTQGLATKNYLIAQ